MLCSSPPCSEHFLWKVLCKAQTTETDVLCWVSSAVHPRDISIKLNWKWGQKQQNCITGMVYLYYSTTVMHNQVNLTSFRTLSYNSFTTLPISFWLWDCICYLLRHWKLQVKFCCLTHKLHRQGWKGNIITLADQPLSWEMVRAERGCGDGVSRRGNTPPAVALLCFLHKICFSNCMEMLKSRTETGDLCKSLIVVVVFQTEFWKKRTYCL